MEDHMPRKITDEEICYLRIFHLLLRVANPVVRDTFNTEFHPKKLKAEFSRNYNVLLDLKKKRVIDKQQWELIFPNSEPVSSEKFDITLMACLLRNLANIDIQDCLPTCSDKSLAADLSRIKTYRNKVVHCDKGILSQQEFNQYWGDISQAIIRLGGPKYRQRCDDLKQKELDTTDKDFFNEIKNLRRQTIPEGVAVITETLLEEWSQQNERVVRTKAIQTIIKAVEEKAVVTIIGPPGCGKSTSAHHVAVHLNKSMSYEVIPAKRANDIVQYYNPHCNQVFVFDDICGKSTLDKQKVVEWRDLAKEVNILTTNNRIKVLATCRSYIFKERLIANIDLLSSNCVDFTSEHCCLSEKEKLDIARVFFDENDIIALQNSKQYTKYDSFPLLCEFYSKNRKGSIEVFFSSPIEAIISELSRLNDDFDQTNIATLFLFVVYNNCIPITILNSQSDLKQILETIVLYFDYASSLNFTVVKQKLQHQISCFTKISDDIYSIIHDKIFDILVLFFGQNYFKLCLKIGHPEIIRDRFQFESTVDNSAIQQQSCMIKVPVSLEESYFDRLCQDLSKGSVDDVFNNTQLTNVQFQTKFVQNFKHRDSARDKILSLSHTDWSPILIVARHGYFALVKMLIDMGLNVNICDTKGRTPLFFASYGGHRDITKLLLKHHANAKICDKKERSPLYIASVRGFAEIVALLLKEGVMNISTINGVPPLYIATVFGNTDIVKLYLENGFDANVQTKHKQTPIYAACYLNHVDIVKLLLNVNCNTNICTESSESPLLVACRYGYTSIVELLLVNGSDPDLCNTNTDRTSELHSKNDDFIDTLVLHETIEPALLEVLKNILKVDRKIFHLDCDRILRKKNESPLFIASYMGYFDIVKLLLDHHCNPNFDNYFEESPVDIAVKHGHTEIVELLLKYKADHNLCNKDCVYPLEQAVSECAQMTPGLFENMNDLDGYKGNSSSIQNPQSRLKTVKLLLQSNADPNLCDAKTKHYCLQLRKGAL
ncbi:Hypothetical predicted protein [Mytilus galloprovincialis]|uniref:DZIP3-like HEPN domain-containing protein n=1 Tax=Mytilus galloprovincialis TaxID=29158 RepID=A0A8B6HJ51_MYTGA|nr:Hypothetical predicted protein [Mytilus galloprovincialis]